MSESKFLLPDVGEGLTEAEIVEWKVAPGDTVSVNQVLVEIETAKSLVELPSPFAGTVGELLVSEGQTVDVGTPIITVSSSSADAGVSLGAPPTDRLLRSTKPRPTRPRVSHMRSMRSPRRSSATGAPGT